MVLVILVLIISLVNFVLHISLCGGMLLNKILDMARVYNWDVKRRQSEKASTS